MTLFEYISVAVSLVLSLSLVRLLNGLSVTLFSERRYWVHSLWLIEIVLLAALAWWNLWGYQNAEWNFFSFLLVLAVPGSLYLVSAALVPENPGQIDSWEAYFFSARRRFFFALAGFFLVVATATSILLGRTFLSPPRIAQTIGGAMALVGALSENRKLHGLLPICYAVLFTMVSLMLFLRPGSVASPP